MKTHYQIIIGFLFLNVIFALPTKAQQQITVDVSPNITTSIKGNSELNRKKYINLAANPSELNKNLNTDRFNRYMNDLDMTVGRSLSVVNAEKSWGDGYREDANRPGWMDTTYYKSRKNPSDSGLEEYISLYGSNAGVAAHDGRNAYPTFMPQYTFADSGDENFPENNDAAAEMAAFTLKYGYTDFQRPQYFELVNEPHWKFWGDQRFADHHTKTHQKFKEMNIPTEVGGPCYSVGNFYKKNFVSLNQITGFIDKTNFELDFYSFHIYDYLKWSDTDNDFVGAVSSGLPEEAVFDAVAAYTFNKFGKEFSFVGSEHGGYNTDDANRAYIEDKLSNQYFPGSGFEHEMEKRSISNFVMVNSAITNTLTFMNHPHIVKKSVPFILLESSGWDPKYYASLMVKKDFNKNSLVWYESKLVYFYEFFKDVDGRRVQSICNDADIQQISLVDGNRLIMVFHNQSNVPGEIDMNLANSENQIQGITIRRLGRQQDFRPYLTEKSLPSLKNVSIGAQESVVVFVTFGKVIDQEKKIDIIPYYSSNVSTSFSGSRDFKVEVPDPENLEYAVLRVGIGREAAGGKEVEISFNGTPLNIPVEDCAERLTSSDYGTMRSVQLDPSMVKATNTVRVRFPDGKMGGVGAVVIRAGKLKYDSLQSINIQDTLKIYNGQKTSLKPIFIPTSADNKNVLWKSLDENIVTVESGKIEAKSIGAAHIIVTTVEGGFADTCTVVVNEFMYKSFIPKNELTAIYADDEGFTQGMLKERAVDGDVETFWHTEWIPTHNPLPHEIWIDLGNSVSFNEFLMTPRQDIWGPNGTIGAFEIYVSNDTTVWGEPVLQDSFIWNPDGLGKYYYKEIQQVNFPEITGRFFRLVALTEHQNSPAVTTTCVAEMDFATPATDVEIADSLALNAREEFTFQTKVLPLGSVIDGEFFNWKSLDESVAIVENGKITAVSEGGTQIIVESFGGEFSDTCTVIVTEPLYKIQFEIKDKANIHSGVTTLNFDGIDHVSDTSGKVSVDGIIAGFYSFDTQNAKYNPFSGSVLVTSDTTIAVVLDYITGINTNESDRISMYPNPATKTVVINAESKGTVRFINLDGKVLLEKEIFTGRNEFDLATFQTGNYIVHIQLSDKVMSGLLSVIK